MKFTRRSLIYTPIVLNIDTRMRRRNQRRGQMSSLLKLKIPVQDTVHVLLVFVRGDNLRFGDT